MSTQNRAADRPSSTAAKPYKGPAMEGPIARWYTKVRANDRELAPLVRRLGELLPAGSRILEAAPGPGTLAIELARLGYQVVGLDISQTFVEIARSKAEEAGVMVDFRHGNASAMPFEAEAFDFVICRAAFKNFTEPVEAIREMRRVLRSGGRALIVDLRRDAGPEDIDQEVSRMGLGLANRLMTKATFTFFLLKNAYTAAEMRQMAAQTDFRRCEVHTDAVGMEVWLEA
jgi:ubiquinone/menaquinone biosynthesis C-methylase UbiE